MPPVTRMELGVSVAEPVFVTKIVSGSDVVPTVRGENVNELVDKVSVVVT